MPTTDFSKNITVIYNSKLPCQLKNDVTCRLLCEHIQSASASIVLYDGKTDQLVAKGTYIDRGRSKLEVHDEYLRMIMDDISVFEFFDSEKHNISFFDFTQSSIYGKTAKTIGITEEHFYHLQELWRLAPYREAFKRYKEVLLEERHAIDNENPLGSYFMELLQGPGMIQQGGFCRTLHVEDLFPLASLDVYGEHTGWLVAAPLLFNDRFTGILKLVFSHAGEPDNLLTRVAN